MSRKLIKSTLVTGGMTLLSRISGLVRDMAFAHLLGASAGVAADAFYVAFRIPNFFRRIFGEGAFAQAFVPVLAEHKTRGVQARLRAFVDHVAGVFALVLFLVTLIGVVAAPVVVLALAPGFAALPEKYELTVQMLRITFPYLFFISLVAMAGGILNTYGRFGVAAFTPVLLNLCLIGAVFGLAPYMQQPALALAWGVFIAGLVQLLFQIPFLRRLGLLPRPRLFSKESGAGRVFRLMLPAIFGVSVAQINMLVNTLLASFLVTGSVSWLYYSDRLMEFPLGVFGIALATVILPSLSRKHAAASMTEFSHLLDWALRWVFLIATPATVALIVLSRPLLITLFQYGAFGATDVEMAARAVEAFAFGLLGFVLVKVLAPGFYARQDTRTPARIAVVAMLANVLFSLALVFSLAHVGLALAISLAAFVNAALLFHLLRRQRIYTALPGWPRYFAQVAGASALMGLILWWGAGEAVTWSAASAWERAARLALWVGVGGIVYVSAILALGIRPRQLLLKKVDGAPTSDE